MTCSSDKPRARALFTDLCTKKNALGCFNLGLIFAKGLDGPQDLPQALTFLQQACDGGNAKGCEIAGQIRDDQAKQEAAAKAAAAAAAKKGGKRK